MLALKEWLVGVLALVVGSVAAQNLRGIDLGYPAAWNGDKYKNTYCPSAGIPKFLDGYFLCQVSASYGDSKNPKGKRLNHLIDAIGAVASFHISQGQVYFSAAYYPATPYKIWEFYGRNFSKSSVPWAGWSAYNVTAMRKWEQIPKNPDAVDFHPSLDFWRIGKRIVAGTEAPDWVGLTFNVANLTNFEKFNFTEDNDIFGRPDADIIPITMPIHEKQDPVTSLIWGAAVTMSFPMRRFYHVIFTIDQNGVRKVMGQYEYGSWDTDKCTKDFSYTGDRRQLPGYMHSIASTANYIILPVTSLVINPCKFRPPKFANADQHVQDGGMWGMDFYADIPMRILVFNKNTRRFETLSPLEVKPAMWVSHQFNAFEDRNGFLIADMVVYDNHDPYAKFFYTEYLKRRLYPNAARFLRFTIDVKRNRAKYDYLLPQETISAEFPRINPLVDGKPYEWAYMVTSPFSAGSSIQKINVLDATGGKNSQFRAGNNIVLHEPTFVPRPSARREDDGVLLIKALDTVKQLGMLIILDATSMTQIGWARAPTVIPFGFHNRFYSKQELGLPLGLPTGGATLPPPESVYSTVRPYTGPKPRVIWTTTTAMPSLPTRQPSLPPRPTLPTMPPTRRTWAPPQTQPPPTQPPLPPRTTRWTPRTRPTYRPRPYTPRTYRPRTYRPRPVTYRPQPPVYTTKRWTYETATTTERPTMTASTTRSPPTYRPPTFTTRRPVQTTTEQTLAPEIETPVTPYSVRIRVSGRIRTPRPSPNRKPWRPQPPIIQPSLPKRPFPFGPFNPPGSREEEPEPNGLPTLPPHLRPTVPGSVVNPIKSNQIDLSSGPNHPAVELFWATSQRSPQPRFQTTTESVPEPQPKPEVEPEPESTLSWRERYFTWTPAPFSRQEQENRDNYGRQTGRYIPRIAGRRGYQGQQQQQFRPTEEPDYEESVTMSVVDEQYSAPKEPPSALYQETARALCTWMPAVFRRIRNVCDAIDTRPMTSSDANILMDAYQRAKQNVNGPPSAVDRNVYVSCGCTNSQRPSIVDQQPISPQELASVERAYRKRIEFAAPMGQRSRDSRTKLRLFSSSRR